MDRLTGRPRSGDMAVIPTMGRPSRAASKESAKVPGQESHPEIVPRLRECEAILHNASKFFVRSFIFSLCTLSLGEPETTLQAEGGEAENERQKILTRPTYQVSIVYLKSS